MKSTILYYILLLCIISAIYYLNFLKEIVREDIKYDKKTFKEFKDNIDKVTNMINYNIKINDGLSPWVDTFPGLKSSIIDYCFPLNESYTNDIKILHKSVCTTSFEYFSSPYETKQMEIAKSIDIIRDFDFRMKTLVEVILSEVELKNSYNWVNRVKSKMMNENDVRKNDLYLLSRFEYKKQCDGKPLEQWTTWIEPITIHVRNPYSIYECLASNNKYFGYNISEALNNYPNYISVNDGIINTDHILLSSKGDYLKKYLLDAGTSTFQSSLWWFVCAYMKKKFKFDKVYGWEKSLLEPTSFWNGVPDEIKKIYSFFNIPITSGVDDSNGPLRFIKENAKEEDFVAFKLDVDSPEVENPTALRILNDKSVSNLIDEFFFEFHFRCELMMGCGWEHKIPVDINSLKLSRWQIMNYFKKLRVAGVRSHIWP